MGLAFFSDIVSAEKKLAVVQRSLRGVAERKVKGNSSMIENEPTLGDFASARTKQLLHRFNIDSFFLRLSPELWADNENYIRGKERLTKLRVVNSTADKV